MINWIDIAKGFDSDQARQNFYDWITKEVESELTKELKDKEKIIYSEIAGLIKDKKMVLEYEVSEDINSCDIKVYLEKWCQIRSLSTSNNNVRKWEVYQVISRCIIQYIFTSDQFIKNMQPSSLKIEIINNSNKLSQHASMVNKDKEKNWSKSYHFR